jgi:hypothetical protein
VRRRGRAGRGSQIGWPVQRLYAESLDEHLVLVAPNEDPNAAEPKPDIQISYVRSIREECQSVAEKANGQIVLGSADMNRAGRRPRHEVDPAVIIATPDTCFTAITDFGYDVLASLIQAITAARPLIPQDEPVTTTWRASDLAKCGADDDVAGYFDQRRTDRDELARDTGGQQIASVCKAGSTRGVLSPGMCKALVHQDARRDLGWARRLAASYFRRRARLERHALRRRRTGGSTDDNAYPNGS